MTLIKREDAIETVYRLVAQLPPKLISSKEPNKIYPSDVVKALYALPSAEAPTDLISKAEVLETYADLYHEFEDNPNICKELHKVYDRINALQSAEAKPKVIRSKTLMPTKDFKEWAKRIRETNPNAVVIPCDAEVVSADAVEVVRCKDCKWSDWYKTLDGEHRCYCMVHGSSGHTDDDYCSYGEREDGEV